MNLGRYKAVAKYRARTLRGFPAWWLARTYHVSQIPGTARKVRAVMDWTVGLPFGRDIAEVGSIGHPTPLRPEPEPSPAPAVGAAGRRAGRHLTASRGEAAGVRYLLIAGAVIVLALVSRSSCSHRSSPERSRTG